MVTLALLSCTLACVGVRKALGFPKGGEGDKESAFVGTWKGICEDKRPFVVVILHEEKGKLAGTLSIANMHGNVDGGCEEVVDPPTPEHAQEIHDVKVEGLILSFSWGKKVGYQVARFQMSLVGKREAELKFFGTPSENNPWKLVKD
jgi:hypothetical protein